MKKMKKMPMGLPCVLLVLVLVMARSSVRCVAATGEIVPAVVMSLSSSMDSTSNTHGKKNSEDVVYLSSSFSVEDLRDDVYLLAPPLGTACSLQDIRNIPGLNVDSMNKNPHGWIALVDRGNCNFAEKAKIVRDLGASVMILSNTLDSLVNQTTGFLRDPCSVNCNIASSTSQSRCAELCPSKMCASSRSAITGATMPYCCVVDDLIPINLGPEIDTFKFPILVSSIQDGNRIKDVALKSQATEELAIYHRPIATVDPSVIIIALIGIVTVISASYRSASRERKDAAWAFADGSGVDPEAIYMSDGDPDDTVETVDLSFRQILSFLSCSVILLVALFFIVEIYPHLAVMVLNVIFGLGATGSLSFMFIHPILRSRAFKICMCNREVTCLLVSRGEMFSLLIAFVISSFWFFTRHESYAWFLQDILAFSLCFTFLLSIRIQSLKTGTGLLLLFFFYDIFMVFISPSIFGGKSVMVEVATAGGATEVVDNSGQCIRSQEERMPMLFAVPRFDWIGGYSMLGLGDIFIPGILISFALRVDYAKIQKVARQAGLSGNHLLPGQKKTRIFYYWIPLCIAYLLGLIFTFVANINRWTFGTGVQGQPALLYLVPFTLSTFIILAKLRGELPEIWTGDWFSWVALNDEIPIRTEDSLTRAEAAEEGNADISAAAIGQTPTFSLGEGGSRIKTRNSVEMQLT